MPVEIDRSLCTGCKLCMESCPEDVFKWDHRSNVPCVFRPDECFHCGACIMDCPGHCIHLVLPLPLRPRFIEKGVFDKIIGRHSTPE